MAPAPESAPDSVAVKFDIKETVEAKDEINQAEKEENEGKNQNQSTGTALQPGSLMYVRSVFPSFAAFALYFHVFQRRAKLQDTSGQAC